MSGETSNDNKSPLRSDHGPDAHGQAALLLAETLIHGLIARSVISVADAMELVETAADVAKILAEDRHSTQPSLGRSIQLINTISRSLANDLPRK